MDSPRGDVSRETLMRFLDGELPPEERRRVEEVVAGSTELQREVMIFRALHDDLSGMRFRPEPGVRLPSVWAAVHRRLTRPIGWLLISGGLAVWLTHAIYIYLVSPAPSWEKVTASAVVIGFLLLFASVIHERYREWLTDPYRDVRR